MTAIEQCSVNPHTNMADTLCTPQVRTVLNRLFAAAAHDQETARWRKPGLSWETATAQERADASESTYMPISPEGGDGDESDTARPRSFGTPSAVQSNTSQRTHRWRDDNLALRLLS
jgi:hypothetical protein